MDRNIGSMPYYTHGTKHTASLDMRAFILLLGSRSGLGCRGFALYVKPEGRLFLLQHPMGVRSHFRDG